MKMIHSDTGPLQAEKKVQNQSSSIKKVMVILSGGICYVSWFPSYSNKSSRIFQNGNLSYIGSSFIINRIVLPHIVSLVMSLHSFLIPVSHFLFLQILGFSGFSYTPYHFCYTFNYLESSCFLIPYYIFLILTNTLILIVFLYPQHTFLILTIT